VAESLRVVVGVFGPRRLERAVAQL